MKQTTKQLKSEEKLIKLGDEVIRIERETVPTEQKEKVGTKELIKQLEKITKKIKVFPEPKEE